MVNFYAFWYTLLKDNLTLMICTRDRLAEIFDSEKLV